MAVLVSFACQKTQSKFPLRFHFFCYFYHSFIARYRKAFHIVAGQYAKAILVDSFDTVREILSREARSLYQSETLIALDRINAPDLQPELRQLKLDGHPMFDIVQKPKDIARIEMAVRLAIGNTIVCTSRESARKTAYYDNQTRHFNAISAECGTYFKSNGEISAYFGNNNKKDDCDEDSYIKEELKFKETEKKYLKAQEHLATLKTELEPINAEVLRFGFPLSLICLFILYLMILDFERIKILLESTLKN